MIIVYSVSVHIVELEALDRAGRRHEADITCVVVLACDERKDICCTERRVSIAVKCVVDALVLNGYDVTCRQVVELQEVFTCIEVVELVQSAAACRGARNEHIVTCAGQTIFAGLQQVHHHGVNARLIDALYTIAVNVLPYKVANRRRFGCDVLIAEVHSLHRLTRVDQYHMRAGHGCAVKHAVVDQQRGIRLAVIAVDDACAQCVDAAGDKGM